MAAGTWSATGQKSWQAYTEMRNAVHLRETINPARQPVVALGRGVSAL